MKLKTILAALVLCLGQAAFTEDNHNDSKEHAAFSKEEHDDQKEPGHDEEKEENSQVGKGKGIVSASAEKGFKIADVSEKNFNIQKVKYLPGLEISKGVVVTAGTERNVYRYREGYYKRIDFHVQKAVGNKIFIFSDELQKGDEVVVVGMGYLRIVELAAFNETPNGHSH